VSIAGGLLGGAFISKYSLKRSLFILALCVNVPNACYTFLSYTVTPDNPLSFDMIATVISIEKFFYGFGFVGNMLYMMQQIAPGKFKMTHYAFATAFMNLVLTPTQMVSGPLADMMGFKPFFWLVLAAAAPSLIAAWVAPFPQLQAPNEDIAVDDESLLSSEEMQGQAAARSATSYALLATALFLLADVIFLGWMSSAEHGTTLAFFLVLMILTTVAKVRLALKAVVTGKLAVALHDKMAGAKPYLSNAKGAVIGGTIMLAVSVLLTGHLVKTAVNTDWGCAFSDNSVSCLQPDKEAPSACEGPSPQRECGLKDWLNDVFGDSDSDAAPCVKPGA
jgi:PAT family beta-lactamase induction signal transducer AmpG